MKAKLQEQELMCFYTESGVEGSAILVQRHLVDSNWLNSLGPNADYKKHDDDVYTCKCSGLSWQETKDAINPPTGVNLEKLKENLQTGKLTFEQTEWDEFQIQDLNITHVVEVDDLYKLSAKAPKTTDISEGDKRDTEANFYNHLVFII